jgi:hypothetical protein
MWNAEQVVQAKGLSPAVLSAMLGGKMADRHEERRGRAFDYHL